ncbi:MAG: hypothetical protein JW741_12460 [Sedimentisphaerales bacterium]|nr:hypothetical protein [Sedimentisphaerales bacterium]
MELLATRFDHDGTFERLPAPRIKAAIERWTHRMDMEQLVRRHTADTNAAMAPVDRMMALLHGGAN